MLNMVLTGGFTDAKIEPEARDLEIEKQPTIFVSSGSSVFNGISIQLGSSAEEFEKFLEKLPPEAIGEILKAIAVHITKTQR